MNVICRSFEQWCDYVGGCFDFCFEEGIFCIVWDMFIELELFDLEMELIFEKNWIYVCYESELVRFYDFVILCVGCQLLIVICDGNGQLYVLVNVCQYCGVILVWVGKGNQLIFICLFYVWCYKNDGWLVKVKVLGEYLEGFDKVICGLKKVCIQSYRGFVFVSLDVVGEDDLVDFFGDVWVFFDMLVVQFFSGELEVLFGIFIYIYEGNWKLQNENGLDGYYVSIVYYNYVVIVQYCQQVEVECGGVVVIFDYSKFGVGDVVIDDGWFFFVNGYSVFFSEMFNFVVCFGYVSVMLWLVVEYGQVCVEWMMYCLCNFNFYFSLFVIDQISLQLCIVCLLVWNCIEIVSQCIGVKGELDVDWENWICQFEDFFNVFGMGMFDDLVEFCEVQCGFQVCLECWSDIFCGYGKWFEGVMLNSQVLGIVLLLIGIEIIYEGFYVNQYVYWWCFFFDGLECLVLCVKEVIL